MLYWQSCYEQIMLYGFWNIWTRYHLVWFRFFRYSIHVSSVQFISFLGVIPKRTYSNLNGNWKKKKNQTSKRTSLRPKNVNNIIHTIKLKADCFSLSKKLLQRCKTCLTYVQWGRKKKASASFWLEWSYNRQRNQRASEISVLTR